MTPAQEAREVIANSDAALLHADIERAAAQVPEARADIFAKMHIELCGRGMAPDLAQEVVRQFAALVHARTPGLH